MKKEIFEFFRWANTNLISIKTEALCTERSKCAINFSKYPELVKRIDEADELQKEIGEYISQTEDENKKPLVKRITFDWMGILIEKEDSQNWKDIVPTISEYIEKLLLKKGIKVEFLNNAF